MCNVATGRALFGIGEDAMVTKVALGITELEAMLVCPADEPSVVVSFIAPVS